MTSTATATTSGHTILVADDNEDIVFVIRNVLEEGGHGVVTAGTVREALDALDEHPGISLVISDVRMPGEDGFDLVRVLRHRLPSLPVILMTGMPITDDDVVPAGATVLTKPVDLDSLEKIVAEALAARAAGAADK